MNIQKQDHHFVLDMTLLHTKVCYRVLICDGFDKSFMIASTNMSLSPINANDYVSYTWFKNNYNWYNSIEFQTLWKYREDYEFWQGESNYNKREN